MALRDTKSAGHAYWGHRLRAPQFLTLNRQLTESITFSGADKKDLVSYCPFPLDSLGPPTTGVDPSVSTGELHLDSR